MSAVHQHLSACTSGKGLAARRVQSRLANEVFWSLTSLHSNLSRSPAYLLTFSSNLTPKKKPTKAWKRKRFLEALEILHPDISPPKSTARLLVMTEQLHLVKPDHADSWRSDVPGGRSYCPQTSRRPLHFLDGSSGR